MKLGELFYSIGADAKEALQKFKEAEEAAKKTAKKIEDSMKLDNLGEGAKKSTDELKGSLDDVGESGEQAGNETKSAFQKIGEKAKELASTIKTHAVTMGQSIITNLKGSVAPATKAFNEIGHAASKLAEKVGDAMSSVGQTLTNKITKPAVAVAGALGGATIFGGFKRLTALDNAQAKLRGIGYEGQQLNNIMTSATEAVTGTVYATADAADVASMALASGVKEGKDLDNYLSNVVNTASYMQAPLSEVAQIFNKVQAEGKLSGDVVSQMAARSVSAVDILADRLGKTPEEIRKMVTEGKISFEDFSNAIGDYMGSAAAEMGGTFTGLVMNLGSRLGILGEKFLGVWSEGSGAYYIMKEELQKLVDLLPSLYDEAEKLGRAFTPMVQGWVDSFHNFKDSFLSLDDDVRKRVVRLVGSFAALAIGIGPFLQMSGAMLTAGGKVGQTFTKLGRAVFAFGGMLVGAEGAGAFRVFAGTMAQTVGTFSLAIAGFGALAVAVGGVAAIIGLLPEQFREDLTTMLGIVDETLPMLSEKLTTFFTENLPQAVSDGLATLGEVFSTMGNVFDSMGEVASSLLEGLIAGFKQSDGQWATAAISMVTSLGNALISNVGELLRLGALFVGQLGQGIADNADEIIAYIPTLIDEIASFISSSELGAVFDAALAIVLAVGKGIINNVDELASAALHLVVALGGFIQQNAGAVMGIVGILVVGMLAKYLIVAAVKKLATVALAWLGKLVVGLVGGVPLLITAGAFLIAMLVGRLMQGDVSLSDVGTWLIEKFSAAIRLGKDIVKGAWDFVTGVFTDNPEADEGAAQAGRNTTAKYAEGIEEGKETVDASADSLMAGLLESLDAGEGAHESGRQTADSFGAGIQEGTPYVEMIAQQLGISVEEAAQMFNGPMYSSGLDLTSSLGSGVQDGTPGLFDAGASASGEVKDGADSKKGQINTSGMEIMSEYRLGVLQQRMQMRTAGTTLTTRLADGIKSAQGAIENAALQIMDSFRKSLMSRQASVASVGRQTTQKLAQQAQSVSLFGAGTNIMAGLRNGLQAGFNSVRSFMYSAMAELQSIVTRMNAIRSPSRVYLKFGRFFMEGLGIGIDREFDNVKDMVTHAMKELQALVSGTSLGSVELAGSSFEATAHQAEELRERQAYQFELQEEMVFLLRKLLQKDTDLIINGRVLSEEILDDINHLNDLYANRSTRIRGGAAHP